MIANINGCPIYYEVHGDPASSPNPTIVCLHGAPGLSSGDEAKGWVGPLIEDHPIVFFDFRGSGRSGDPPEETLTHAQMVDDVAGLLDHIGIEKAVIFGGSYGGFLGMEFAIVHPDRLSHLVLRGTASWCGPEDEAYNEAIKRGVKADPKELKRLFDGHVRDNDDYQALFRMIYPLYSTKYDPAMLDASMKNRHWHYQTHNKVYGIERRSYDLRKRLGNITAKTLVIAGRHDWITPPQYAEEIARGIPNSDLVIFGHAGHAVHADVPQQFFPLVREFIHR